jgi:ABC-type uncharacterized transport system auxiliary subunit
MVQNRSELRDSLQTYSLYLTARKELRSLLLAASIVVISGCALWNTDAVVFHAINYPAPKANREHRIPETIMVYRLLMDSKVDSHYLAISNLKGKARSVSGYAWVQDPSEMLTELVTRDLESSGLFEKAIDQTSNLPYRYGLEGQLKKFEGVINNGKGTGLIQAEVRLIDFEHQSAGNSELIKKLYIIEVPSVDTKPESIVKALDKASMDLSEKIRNDVGKILINKN